MSRRLSRGLLLRAGNRRVRLGMILCSLGLVVGCVIVRYYWGADSARAGAPATTTAPTAAPGRNATTTQPSAATDPNDPSTLAVMAVVNGREITRSELGSECLRHYGEEVLESHLNKLLIAQECRRRGITITRAEVDAEIERLALRFKLPKEQWLKMLQTERGISPAQYASDIIWPTLALRRLAGDRLTVTQDELQEALEANYGPAVRARLISCEKLEKAQWVRAQAVANPEEFGNLAKEHSEDASASLKGLIQPIHRHSGYEQIEQVAFTMADGEVSPVIPAAGQYVILKREGSLPAQQIDYELVVPQLEELVRDNKLREAASDIFRQLQESSQVENVWNDPQKRSRMPGVAAVVNGQKISVDELAEQCIERHGPEVLDDVINRTLIELACASRQITITQAEIDAEVRRAAELSLPLTPDGSPDVDTYLKLVTEDRGIAPQTYLHDLVWPSVGLKKLVGDRLWASQEKLDEDLRKGYEANYGPRVRCLAIVLDNLRRAQQVWEMAHGKGSAEYFAELAAQYSIEPGSRALRGEVPPIQRHGGEPLLEEEAFSLTPGELSGVVQVGDRYVILYCQGRTEPVAVSFAEVRDELYQYVFEKKQRLAMAEYFEQLQAGATIDNYLAGTSQSPKRPAGSEPTANLSSLPKSPGS